MLLKGWCRAALYVIIFPWCY